MNLTITLYSWMDWKDLSMPNRFTNNGTWNIFDMIYVTKDRNGDTMRTSVNLHSMKHRTYFDFRLPTSKGQPIPLRGPTSSWKVLFTSSYFKLFWRICFENLSILLIKHIIGVKMALWAFQVLLLKTSELHNPYLHGVYHS